MSDFRSPEGCPLVNARAANGGPELLHRRKPE